MTRLRRWFVVCFVVVAAGYAAVQGQPPPGSKTGEEKWLIDRALTITPRGEPEPALKYRLLPLTTDLKDGNAVPIYLRLKHEQNDETRKDLMNTPQPWINLPLKEMPLAEAHKYLERFSRYYQQIDLGARRKFADWNYTIDQPDPISLLLPDMNQMRGMAPLLVLRLKVQIAEGEFAPAAQSVQTGFGFARHVGNGPCMINGLVGLAIAQIIAGRIPDWIEQPEAPNLYWALTALPRPMIDIRSQLELEQRFIELQFPDLATLDRPRSVPEWDGALKRFRTEMRRIDSTMTANNPGSAPPLKEQPLPDPDEPADKSPDLFAARMYLTGRSGKSAEAVAAMPPAQALLLYIYGTSVDFRDNQFKIGNLPYAEFQRWEQAAHDEYRAMPRSEGIRLTKMFLPYLGKVIGSQNRLERHIALLRTIEALRLHAASHGGQLPESLDKIKEVPVPRDPGTDQPFEYKRDGATATLSSRIPGEPLEIMGLRYRLTVRK